MINYNLFCGVFVSYRSVTLDLEQHNASFYMHEYQIYTKYNVVIDSKNRVQAHIKCVLAPTECVLAPTECVLCTH